MTGLVAKSFYCAERIRIRTQKKRYGYFEQKPATIKTQRTVEL